MPLFLCGFAMEALGETREYIASEKAVLETFLNYEEINKTNYARLGYSYIEAFWDDPKNGIVTDENNYIIEINWNYEDYDPSVKLRGEIDLTGFVELQKLYLHSNEIHALEVNGLANLQELYCGDNQLQTLDLSGLSELQKLYCFGNPLQTLDLSHLSRLTELSCSDNQLSTLDVSPLTRLEKLYCGDNQLQTLDLSGLAHLEVLSCGANEIETLIFPEATVLKELQCEDNKLQTLDPSVCAGLTYFYCVRNYIPFSHLTQLLDALPENCITNYSGQRMSMEVWPGQRLTLADLGLSLGKGVKYGQAAWPTEDWPGAYTVPTDEDEVELRFTFSNYADFDLGPLSYTLLATLPVPPVTSVYHTIDLTVGEGIDASYPTGLYTVAQGDHFFLQFLPQDRKLTARNVILLVDGVDTAFKASGSGFYYSYILNPIEKDHNLEVRLRKTHPTTGMSTLDAAVRVYTRDGQLAIETPTRMPATVYTLTGQLLRHQMIQGTATFALPAGIYMVHVGETTYKVNVGR